MSADHGPPRFRLLTVEQFGDVTVVCPIDHKIVTEEHIQEFGEELYAVVEELKPANLLIDFANVQFVSSAAIGKLNNTKRKALRISAKLMLCGIHPDLLEVFRMTRLDQVYNIVEDRDQAIAAFEHTVLVSCPLARCGGRLRSTSAGVSMTGDVLRCPRCGSRIAIAPSSRKAEDGGQTRIRIASLTCDTYDHEFVKLSCSWRIEVAIVGRLDLFVFEALERVWITVPPPRRIVLDLRKVTEWTAPAIAGLHDLRSREGEGEGTALVIDEGAEGRADIFPAGWTIHRNTWEADWELDGRLGRQRVVLSAEVKG
jgi:anti-sigma B factor antagonist